MCSENSARIRGRSAAAASARGATAIELLVAHLHAQAAGGHVEFDDVAVAHQRERPADEGFRRDVQHAGAVARAAHARVGDAHHVAHALGQQFLRDRQLAPFRHARRAERSGVLEHQDRVLVDVEVRIVDARRHVVVVVEHDRLARVCFCRCASAAGGLITAPSGARLPRSTARLSDATSGLFKRPDHVVVVDLSPADILAERRAVHGPRAGLQPASTANC